MILMDEFQISVLVPSNLSQEEYSAIRRTLIRKRLRIALKRAVRTVIRRSKYLRVVKIRVVR
jgi:hypothetical protein